MSLSNEHAEMTILLASFPLKADGNIVTNYDCMQQKATQYSKGAIDDLVRLSLECYLVLTYD